MKSTQLKGLCRASCLNLSSHQLKFKNNGPVLLFKAISRHETFFCCLLLYGWQGNGLKLEKVAPIVQLFICGTARLRFYYLTLENHLKTRL